MAKKLYKNKKVIIILTIVAVAAVGAAGYVWRNNHKSTPPSSYDTSKPENQESAVDTKKDTDNAQRQNATTSGSSTAPGSVTPQITYFGQANDTVILDATVTGATSGTCTVTFKNGGATVTKTSSVSLVTSYYACGEIQAPSSEFNPKGSWSANVTLNNGPASQPVEANIN